MYCKNCGGEILEGSKFCTGCGGRISAEDIKKALAPLKRKRENWLIAYLMQLIIASIAAYNLPAITLNIENYGWKTSLNLVWVFSCIYSGILIIVGFIRIFKKNK